MEQQRRIKEENAEIYPKGRAKLSACERSKMSYEVSRDSCIIIIVSGVPYKVSRDRCIVTTVSGVSFKVSRDRNYRIVKMYNNMYTYPNDLRGGAGLGGIRRWRSNFGVSLLFIYLLV